MFLCVGSTPTLPSIFILHFTFVLESFAEALIQEIATTIYPTLKECMSMFNIILVILLGTAGSLGTGKVVYSNSRVTPIIQGTVRFLFLFLFLSRIH